MDYINSIKRVLSGLTVGELDLDDIQWRNSCARKISRVYTNPMTFLSNFCCYDISLVVRSVICTLTKESRFSSAKLIECLEKHSFFTCINKSLGIDFAFQTVDSEKVEVSFTIRDISGIDLYISGLVVSTLTSGYFNFQDELLTINAIIPESIYPVESLKYVRPKSGIVIELEDSSTYIISVYELFTGAVMYAEIEYIINTFFKSSKPLKEWIQKNCVKE